MVDVNPAHLAAVVSAAGGLTDRELLALHFGAPVGSDPRGRSWYEKAVGLLLIEPDGSSISPTVAKGLAMAVKLRGLVGE